MAVQPASYPPRPIVDRRRLPPGPPELPLIGQTLRFLRDPIKLMQDAAAYGDLVTISVKPALLYLVNHPDLIREVVVTNHPRLGRGPNTEVLKWVMGDSLVTAAGAEHLRQRRLMQPRFHHRRTADYAAVMQRYARQRRQRWQHGQRVDLAREMGDLTLRIIVKTLFGMELGADAGAGPEPDTPDARRSASRSMGAAFELTNNYLVRRVNQPPRMRRLLHRLPVPYTRRFRRARADLDRIIYGLIAERRRLPPSERADDLLSVLLAAEFEDDNGQPQPLTDEQVRNQTITMFAAGHETTAVCLAWTWHLLATHPEQQARFHQELDDTLAGRPPAIADLPNLPFTDRILTESLRLYPSVWFWSRMSYEPFALGGYEIPAGALITAPPLIIQRDARWFDAPNEFRPDRWTDAFRERLPAYAYFPFGGGPRQCIGSDFALTEAKLILATIGQQWRVRPDPKHRVGMLPLISLRPKGGMPLYLERR